MVELESRRVLGACRHVVSDRVARCAVPIASPGDYPLRTADGQDLGTLAVAATRGLDART